MYRPQEEMVAQCDRLLRAFESGDITIEEALYNLMIRLIHAADHDVNLRTFWDACLDLFPSNLLDPFLELLDRELRPSDFLFCNAAFMADLRDKDAVEKRKQDLRPHFLALYEAVTRRVKPNTPVRRL